MGGGEGGEGGRKQKPHVAQSHRRQFSIGWRPHQFAQPAIVPSVSDVAMQVPRAGKGEGAGEGVGAAGGEMDAASAFEGPPRTPQSAQSLPSGQK